MDIFNDASGIHAASDPKNAGKTPEQIAKDLLKDGKLMTKPGCVRSMAK